MNEPTERREIDLHRRVCAVKPDSIDIRPARSAAVVPLLGFLLGVFAFAAVILWLESIPFFLALVLMGGAILLVPFSGMGFVYSVYGANVVIDREKQSAVWQQGLFGMGVGTEELVPFWKIERIEIEEMGKERGGSQDIVEYEVRLLKTSGRRLTLGQVNVSGDLAVEGLARARQVGEAVATLVEKPLQEIGGRRRRRRRRRRRQHTSPVA